MKYVRYVVGIASAVVLVATAIAASASAVELGRDGIRAYSASTPLTTGTIVQLSDKETDRVASVGRANPKNVLGVVIDPAQLSLRFSDGARDNETFVASSGTYPTLVSTQGGPIATGDYLALSSIDGVAMKASLGDKILYGRASRAFDGKGVVLGTTTLSDTEGKTSKTVALGQIPATIDVKDNPTQKESTKANLPEQLQRVGEQIAEKEVSPIRVYLSVAITIISLLAAIAVLYSGVRSGVISIGRNPMSKKSIFRALLEIILTSCLILIIGLFAVYLLLKL